MAGFHRHRGISSKAKTAVLVIIVILIIAYLALTWHGTAYISTNKTITLAPGQSYYFGIKGSSGQFTIFLDNESGSHAIFYVSKVPVLTSPISAFAIAPSQSANISTYGNSGAANLQVRLIALSSKASYVELLTLPPQYGVKVSSGVEVRNPASFYSPSNYTQPATTPVTTPNTTTNSSKTTTKTNTTTTTPPKSTSTPLENISTILNTTYVYTLMNKFNTLYVKDRACTPALYNQTLVSLGYSPSDFPYTAAYDGTPSGLTVSAVAYNKTKYEIIYNATFPVAPVTQKVAAFNLTTSGVLTNLEFSSSSVYQGQNYTSLDNIYGIQNGIAGDCGAYAP